MARHSVNASKRTQPPKQHPTRYSIRPKDGAAGRSDETKFRMTTYAATPD
jgi:hypothetical protein